MISRNRIRKLLQEAAHANDTHITLTGEAVPFGCPECLDDIELRISDMTRSRNRCPSGSAARTHYSGVLHQLRKDRRDAGRIFERDYVTEEDIMEDVRKRGDEYCAYVDDKLTKKEKENNPKKYKGKKVGSVQRTKSGKIRMKARACYKSKKKANNAMAAAMMG